SQLPAVQTHGDRALAQPQACRYLGLRRLLDVALDQDLPRDRRQERQRPIQQLRELVAFQIDLDVELVGQPIYRLRRAGVLGLVRAPGKLATTSARPAPAYVAGNRGEPPVTSARVMEPVRVTPSLDQRLLREILRRVA